MLGQTRARALRPFVYSIVWLYSYIPEKIERSFEILFEGSRHTQNSNESFNSIVWRLNPKHVNSGFKIVEIAANMATGIFNEGYSAVLSTMQLLDIVIGQQCKNFADTVDAERITRENRRASLSSKEARTARKSESLRQNEFFEEEEGLLYGPGIAD